MSIDNHNRRSLRLQNFNYNSVGTYFITICTENRGELLSQIVGGDVPDAPTYVRLSHWGMIADQCIRQMNDFYDTFCVEAYVIMPNHIHLLLTITDEGASRTSPPTKQHSAVSRFVSTFKRFCNKEYGKNIWQRYYNDHIIRNQADFDKHLQYIHNNPIQWKLDELYIPNK